MKPIRIVIVEDDRELLKGISNMLAASDDVAVEASFNNAEDFLKNVTELKPEVVLMDIGLPGASGIECEEKLKPEHPQMQFLMWTTFEDDEKIFDALQAGANGYLLKNSTTQTIIQSIADIHNGGSPMSSTIARKVIDSFHSAKVKRTEYNLTARENEILDLLAKGYRYKEISAKLSISTETVRKHIRNTYEKLQVQSRTDALNKVFSATNK